MCWGLGPAAVSSMTADGRALRWANPASLEAWEALVLAGRAGQAEREELAAEVRAREALMLALRTSAGLDLAEHTARTGQSLTDEHGELLAQLAQAGLIIIDSKRLRLTRAGMLVSNSVIRALGFENTAENFS